MSTYLDHAGVEIDVAVCSNCETKEVFSEPKELCCVIGNATGNWKCILENLDNPNNTEVICPDCEPTVTGWTYILCSKN